MSPAPSLRPGINASRPVEALAHTSEYSIYGLTREVDQALIRERRMGFAAVLFIAATAIAVLYSVERYLYSRWVGEPVSLRSLLPAELVFTYTWALLAPLVMRLAQRFPLRGREVNRDVAREMPPPERKPPGQQEDQRSECAIEEPVAPLPQQRLAIGRLAPPDLSLEPGGERRQERRPDPRRGNERPGAQRSGLPGIVHART